MKKFRVQISGGTTIISIDVMAFDQWSAENGIRELFPHAHSVWAQEIP